MFHQSLCTVWWRLDRLSCASSKAACVPASEDIATVTDRSAETALASGSEIADDDWSRGPLLPHLPAPA